MSVVRHVRKCDMSGAKLNRHEILHVNTHPLAASGDYEELFHRKKNSFPKTSLFIFVQTKI